MGPGSTVLPLHSPDQLQQWQLGAGATTASVLQKVLGHMASPVWAPERVTQLVVGPVTTGAQHHNLWGVCSSIVVATMCHLSPQLC